MFCCIRQNAIDYNCHWEHIPQAPCKMCLDYVFRHNCWMRLLSKNVAPVMIMEHGSCVCGARQTLFTMCYDNKKRFQHFSIIQMSTFKKSLVCKLSLHFWKVDFGRNKDWKVFHIIFVLSRLKCFGVFDFTSDIFWKATLSFVKHFELLADQLWHQNVVNLKRVVEELFAIDVNI